MLTRTASTLPRSVHRLELDGRVRLERSGVSRSDTATDEAACVGLEGEHGHRLRREDGPGDHTWAAKCCPTRRRRRGQMARCQRRAEVNADPSSTRKSLGEENHLEDGSRRSPARPDDNAARCPRTPAHTDVSRTRHMCIRPAAFPHSVEAHGQEGRDDGQEADPVDEERPTRANRARMTPPSPTEGPRRGELGGVQRHA